MYHVFRKQRQTEAKISTDRPLLWVYTHKTEEPLGFHLHHCQSDLQVQCNLFLLCWILQDFWIKQWLYIKIHSNQKNLQHKVINIHIQSKEKLSSQLSSTLKPFKETWELVEMFSADLSCLHQHQETCITQGSAFRWILYSKAQKL
jgi:hypothetical protein